MANRSYKGYLAEKQVCDILSNNFPGAFTRRGRGVKGNDIVCSDERFKYAPEVKHHKSIRAIHLLIGTNKTLKKMWEQTVKQAELVDKHPVLIVKVDGYFLVTDLDPGMCHWYELNFWCRHPIP